MSSETVPKDKVVRWLPHVHCPVCGNAMAPNKEYCSDKCENFYSKYREQKRKKNKWLYLALLPITVVIVFFLLLQM